MHILHLYVRMNSADSFRQIDEVTSIHVRQKWKKYPSRF